MILLNKKYFLTKYASIFIELLKHDFPQNWPNAFDNLLGIVSQSSDLEYQKAAMCKSLSILLCSFLIDLIMKVLLSFEEDIVERVDGMTELDFQIANRVKEGVRKNAITSILYLLL